MSINLNPTTSSAFVNVLTVVTSQFAMLGIIAPMAAGVTLMQLTSSCVCSQCAQSLGPPSLARTCVRVQPLHLHCGRFDSVRRAGLHCKQAVMYHHRRRYEQQIARFGAAAAAATVAAAAVVSFISAFDRPRHGETRTRPTVIGTELEKPTALPGGVALACVRR